MICWVSMGCTVPLKLQYVAEGFNLLITSPIISMVSISLSGGPVWQTVQGDGYILDWALSLNSYKV